MRNTAAALAMRPTLIVRTRKSADSIVMEDGIRMALSRQPFIRCPTFKERSYIKRLWGMEFVMGTGTSDMGMIGFSRGGIRLS